GFSHISHFSREFKAMFGMNPSEYARRYAKPPAEKG
ncbi:MAG: AraC family transcriptional regulator, partial [Clostridiales bacterium]|nr:AraC family transcriptional regulator [Clostridiales bacterium]